MDACYMLWKFGLFLLCSPRSFALVHIKVVEKEIRWGIPLHLSCEILNDVNIGSRKWFGGKGGNILILNGISSNPAKYHEIRLSSSKYYMRIAEVDENDLNCTYVCRFGFLTDGMFLSADKFNFKFLPKEDTVHVKYVKESGKYCLQVVFDKVFPVPTCITKTTPKARNLTVVDKTMNGFFYAVQFSDISKDPFHTCGSPVEIECRIKGSKYTISRPHSLECNGFAPTSNRDSTRKIVGLVSGIVIFLIIVLATVFIILRKVCKKDTPTFRQEMKNGNLYLKVHSRRLIPDLIE